MDFHALKLFMPTTMSMSHIYRPLLIRTLLENHGEASARLIAKEFLSSDKSIFLLNEFVYY